ncbi:hypothetical protein [Enterobacter bugandensis]|uniref:hypothetical protein n=1 Tax=Enterobacter bugandensis TaxID=881260 RepID=UPI0013D4E98D|nr:hypothetical protein [Enterobacter bugandensis]
MFSKNGVTYTFHHVGIPTHEKHSDERYSEVYKFSTRDDDCSLIRVQWHRFDVDSPLHELIRSQPHIAFKVSDLEKAIVDEDVILGPYEPIPGFKVAVIKNGNISIELIQTTLTDEAIWGKALKENALYKKDKESVAQLKKGIGQ